jgi:hypothetical protein
MDGVTELTEHTDIPTYIRVLSLIIKSEITPWSKVLLEKPLVPQLVKKFPALHETRKLITVFTRPRQVPCVTFPLR